MSQSFPRDQHVTERDQSRHGVVRSLTAVACLGNPSRPRRRQHDRDDDDQLQLLLTSNFSSHFGFHDV